MTEQGKFVDLRKARVDEQRQVMETILEANECPFCSENLAKYHKQEILRKGEQWILTRNQWPYEDTSLHLLAIATYHAEKLADLHEGAFDELQGHMVWAEKEFDIKSGGIGLRFGDMAHTGATVSHFHVHLIVPSADKPEDKIVRFKIG